MRKQDWIDLLEEYKGVIESCQNHHTGKEQIGFNVKVYDYPREEDILDKYREKYKDNPEILNAIKQFENGIYKQYGLFNDFQENAWNYAREYFVGMCTVYSKGYLLKNYKSFPLIKTKKLAQKYERQNEQLRYALSKINEMYSAGRMSGYVIFDYDFYMNLNDIENALYDLDNDITLREFNDYYNLSVREIKEDMKSLKLIEEEVEKFLEGHKKDWSYRVEEELKEKLIEYLPNGRKTLTNMLSYLQNLDIQSSNLSEDSWKSIKEKFNFDIQAGVKESISIIESLLENKYDNTNIEV